jgi:nucleolin
MSVEDDRKLFVAGLADAVTDDVLRQLFEASGGEVQSVTVPVDRATGKPRGFAFVTMGSAEQAGAARQALDGTMQAGRAMSVRLFRADRNSTPPSRGQSYQPEESTLYVGNLPFDSSAAELEEALRAAGVTGIQRIHLPMDPEGRFRGFGFVVLADAAAANQATASLQQAAIRGRALSVSVARARGQSPPSAGRPGVGRPSGPPPSQSLPPSSRNQTMTAGAPRDFRAPEAPKFDSLPPSSRTVRPARWDKDKDKDKGEKKWDAKKKKKSGLEERGPKRRQNEGFRAGRHEKLEDWDDD